MRAAGEAHRLRTGRRPGPEGQGHARSRPGAPSASSPSAAASGARRHSRRRSSAATRSSASSRTCSTRRVAKAVPASSASSGPAGIGKSRLAWEFLKYIDGLVETVWWHDGRSPAYGEGHHVLGARRDDPRPGRAAWRRTTSRRREPPSRRCSSVHVPDEAERAWIAPRSCRLLGLRGRRRDATSSSARGGRSSSGSPRRDPVVLVFEDLHHADPGLLDFIDHLLEVEPLVADPDRHACSARTCSIDDPIGAPGSGRSHPSISSPCPSSRCASCSRGLVPGLPRTARDADRGACRRDPALRGRDRPDAPVAGSPGGRRRHLPARRRA